MMVADRHAPGDIPGSAYANGKAAIHASRKCRPYVFLGALRTAHTAGSQACCVGWGATLWRKRTASTKPDAYPRASGRGREPRTAQTAQLAFTRGVPAHSATSRKAYIVTVMSDKTGEHPVADTAVNPRITATATLLVRPDITHSIRPDCARLTSSRVYGARSHKEMTAPDSEQ
jgi:hypothetical protein